jgi:hypothetical protein
MNPEEPANTLRRIRSVAGSHGLQWIVDEVDEQVSLGIVEVKELREVRRSGEVIYEEFPTTVSSPPRGRRRAEEFITRRPMTVKEQVDALIEALGRVLVDIDAIADASVRQLNDEDLWAAREVPPISEINFVPDEGSTTPAVTTEALRHSDQRFHIAELLRQLQHEVDQ